MLSPRVTLHRLLSLKALRARGAREGLLLCVFAHVHGHVRALAEALVAEWPLAREALLTGVSVFVSFEFFPIGGSEVTSGPFKYKTRALTEHKSV